MRIKEELKLNRFRYVRIPKRGELFRQLGEMNGRQQYTGDQVVEIHTGNKMDVYAEADNYMKEYDKKMQEEANKKK